MPVNFKNSLGRDTEIGMGFASVLASGDLTPSEQSRIRKIQDEWNFYEGYHWEGVDDLGSPQVTFNYCKPFINKFVSFEFGKGFTIKAPLLPESVSEADEDGSGELSEDERSSAAARRMELRERVKNQVANYLETVWEGNDKDLLCEEIGQTKAVTGDAWVSVFYEPFDRSLDVFEENPEGRIRIVCYPTQYVSADYDENDRSRLLGVRVAYPVRNTEQDEGGILGFFRKKPSVSYTLYKEYWSAEEIVTYRGNFEESREDNPYGFIPFVQVKNFPLAGRVYGISDLDDVIPLNVEMNAKRSDISEIIDYHAAPITCVFGARIGNLEKGANKVWGGLPKDAKVSNLELNGDLAASTAYLKDLKTSMCEVAGIPESVLGGATAISNTSGVAMQYMNLPLIERVRVKRNCTQVAFERINKMVLYISLQEGLISKPADMTMKEFLYNVVQLTDTLPKDELIELQKLQQELLMGIECRHGAMERLGKDNIPAKIEEIDRERDEHPDLFNPALASNVFQASQQLNSGMTNGQTAIEQVRREVTGRNGGGEVANA